MCRRLHVTGRPRRWGDSSQERIPGPPGNGNADALDPAAGRLVRWGQCRGYGAGPEKRGREQRQGKRGGHQSRPATGGRWRRIVSARPPGQQHVCRTTRDHTGGQSAARQRGRHWRGQGCSGSLLGHGARYRPALCRRPAGGLARHGLRYHQGGTRRLAYSLYEWGGRQPGRIRRRSHADDPDLPVLSALQRIRDATCVRGKRKRSD